MENEFYTIEEVLLALRIELLNYEKLLNDLKKYLVIESENIKDFYFDSFQKSVYHDELVYKKQLVLIISERLNILNKIREKLLYISGYQYEKNSILFYTVNKNDKNNFDFKLEHKDKLVSINPKINITNQIEFDKLVEEILNINYMNLQKQKIRRLMSDGWYLHIYYRLMHLGNYYKSVIYNPQDDTIKFMGIDYHEEGAKSIIKSQIPKYCIADDIKAIINKNSDKEKIIEFEDYNFDEKAFSFQIEDSSKGIKLLKIR